MDGRDRLRQYLEQRKELGESDLVLDGLSVEELLGVLGARGGALPAAESVSGESQTRAAMPEGGGASPRALTGVTTPQRPAGQGSPQQPVHPPGTPISVGGPIAEAAAATFAAQYKTLDAIAAATIDCRLCGLYETAKHAVPGEGNPSAQFVCVGEAPGATEDETGRPFVGDAGQLLTKILAAIGFRREDVYICNVLKHRPPGNRRPAADEVVACKPYLLQQLALLRPKVILALGTSAAQTLLQTSTPIGKLRGQIHRFYGVPLVATYHPAALLRNPNWKRPTWEDVQLARRVFDNLAGNQ